MKKLIIITGASSGFGAAIAKRMSEKGYPLLLVARRLEKIEALSLPNAICAKVDINDHGAFAKAVQQAEDKFGPTDCLINNAGTMLLGAIESQATTEWQQMFDVNVIALLNGIKTVLPGMKTQQHGTIINISSIAGKKTFPNHAAYCGTKFAVHAISENVREEIANDNIRVITIAPGAAETELLSHTTSNAIKQNYDEWKASMGGVLTADDVARSVIFAYEQPQSVCLPELVIAATRQVQ